MEKEFDDLIKELLKEEASHTVEPSEGHSLRFLDKLNRQKAPKKSVVWKRFSIAASFAILLGLGAVALNQNSSKEYGLASVSAEMKQAETYFTTTIEREMQSVKNEISPETQKIIEDGLIQIQILETEYQNLEQDLIKSGNDQRVIYAMIKNFQTRIEILEAILEQTETIKNLKTIPDENII